AQGPGTPLEPPGDRRPRWMATQDRIRLTGLLRKKPWQRGFFYGGLSATDGRSATSPIAGDVARSLRSSETLAGAGVRLVDSRGAAGRHTREGDVEDVWSGARVEDVVHFARPLDERVPGAVRGALALATDRSVNRGRALLYDD